MTKTIQQLSATYEDMKQTRSLHEAQLDLLRKEVKAKREGNDSCIWKPRRELSNEHRQETLHAGETNEKLQILVFVHMAPQGLIDQTDAPLSAVLVHYE